MSPQAKTVWAKTDMVNPDPRRWLPLHRHLADTMATADQIWEHWLPEHIKQTITQDTGDETNAKNTFLFLAGIHDCGKASPAFAIQISLSSDYKYLVDRMEASGLTISPKLTLQDDNRCLYRHELVGYETIFSWLTSHKVSEKTAATYATVIGDHHGNGVTSDSIDRILNAGKRYLGDKSWKDVRNEFVDIQYKESGMQLPTQPLSRRSQILLGALVIMADWIASDQTLFPLTGSDNVSSIQRAEDAWKRLRLPEPWNPQPSEDINKLYNARFGFMPRRIQTELFRLAWAIDRPEVICVEAPMGEGKTEAALAAAEVLCHRFGFGGIYFALPTQATADAMLERLLHWVERMPSDGRPEAASVFLSHSKRMFNDTFDELPWAVSNVDDGHLQAVSNDWLRGRKRGNLADFVVGTIDQVLAVALKERHMVLRHLAMASKVIVLDEIHACDAYMDEYLEDALEWLGYYEVPVILMSATLTSERRFQLLDAYERGRGHAMESFISAVDTPLLSHSGGILSMPSKTNRHMNVDIVLADDDPVWLRELAAQTVAANGRIAIIRDTVFRAIETFRYLKKHGLNPILDHSRFTARDRSRQDRLVMEAAGPDASKPAIVVATQVIEQSLDVDFDVMVSDVAPMDLLLQRVGRLHRHDKQRPAGFENPRVYVAGVRFDYGSPKFARGIGKVYGNWPLYRTLNVLDLRHTGSRAYIQLPQHLPLLVEKAYRPDGSKWPEEWQAFQKWSEKTAMQSYKAHNPRMLPTPHRDNPDAPSLDGWLNVSKSDKDSMETGKFGVRDGGDTCDVILLNKEHGCLYPMGSDEPLPLDPMDMNRDEWKDIMSSSITVSRFMTGGMGLKQFVDLIDSNAPEAWRMLVETGPLQGQSAIVFENGSRRFLRKGTTPLTLAYDPEEGWRTE